jgi:hypothetical protein
LGQSRFEIAFLARAGQSLGVAFPAALGQKSRREHIMTEDTPALPDRLSNDPSSPFFDEALLNRGVGIRFKGQEKTNVEEYCVSEGWIRVSLGKATDRRGKPLTMKLTGTVEPFLR